MTTSAASRAPRAEAPRWRVLLRPSWIALAAAVVLFAVLCFWVFAPWQLGKHGRTEQRNERIKDALAAPPAPLAELLRAGVGPHSDWRAVSVTGVYNTDKQVLLRERPVQGNAQGPQVLVPFRFDNGKSILVNRGYLPEGAIAAPPAPSGTVTLNAKLRLPEATPAGRAVRTLADGADEVPAIDPPVVQNLTGVQLEPAYLQLSPGQPGALGALEEPNLDPGPYLSYGLQWLAFGVIALAALGYFGYAELRPLSADNGAARPGAERGDVVGGLNRAERKRELRAALAGENHQPAAAGPPTDRYGR
jgi:cytochrome oxidase assembly protein ShyY1